MIDGSIKLYLLVLLISLSSHAIATGELNVSGATVYVIYRAPIKDSENFSTLLSAYRLPSCYRNNPALDKLIARLRNTSSEYTLGQGPSSICGTPWLSYKTAGIKFSYDDYWLIGKKEVKTVVRNSALPLEYTVEDVNDALGDIDTQYKDIRNNKGHPLHNLTQSDTAQKGQFLQIVHFRQVSPLKLSTRGDTHTLEYRTITLSSDYNQTVCKFLRQDE